MHIMPLDRLTAAAVALSVLVLTAGCMTENALEELSGPGPSNESLSAGITGATDGGDETASVTITITASMSDGGEDTEGDAATTGSSGTDTTEGVDQEPPAITKFELDPPSIELAGAIDVKVLAEVAEGVRLTLENGDTIDLAEAEPGKFVGELPVTTGYDNGERIVSATPWRGDVQGDPAEAVYTVALPEPGSEIFWKIGDDKGWTVDVEQLSTGELIEFGVLLDENDDKTCFLRRRNHLGASNPITDEVAFLPGEGCEAIDLAVRDDMIFALAQWKVNNLTSRWWLGVIPKWGLAPTVFAEGEDGDVATAMDLRDDGAVAVCGTTPTGPGDVDNFDAFAWVIEPGDLPEMRKFDYVPASLMSSKHEFDETPHDCLFVGSDRLVMAGEVLGKHDKDADDIHMRRFILPLDLTMEDEGDPPPFVVVAGKGPGDATQSRATSADIDDQGRLLLAGYTCDEQCENLEGHLWVHSLDGTLHWFVPLGLHQYLDLAPSGVRWHPAGYVVVGNGGTLDDKHTLMLRAFAVDDYEPLWTYARADLFQEHFPLAVTIGPYGAVCAGGFGNGIYPGVACVGG